MDSRQTILTSVASKRPVMRGPFRVVIVEETSIAIVLGRILEMLGQQVETARDGRSGAWLVRETEPDVVFTRIELPDMDGYQFAGEIRSSGGRQPVLVAHTGYGKWQIGKEAKEAGFDLLVTKPAPIEELRNVLSFVAGEFEGGSILL